MKLPISNPIKIGVVVVDDGLYTHRWVQALAAAADIELAFVGCISPFQAIAFNPRGARGLWRVALVRCRYYGPRATLVFAQKALAASIRQLGAYLMPAYRRIHSVKAARRWWGIEGLDPPAGDVNAPAYVKAVAAHRPDLLVGAFSQPAAASLLSAPRLGCLNVHFSYLPQHRGREPLFYAMLSGRDAGVSVHWMTPAIDCGRVIYQERLAIERYRTLHEAIMDACALASRVVPHAVRKACAWEGGKQMQGKLPAMHPWPSAAAIRQFKKRGLRFV